MLWTGDSSFVVEHGKHDTREEIGPGAPPVSFSVTTKEVADEWTMASLFHWNFILTRYETFFSRFIVVLFTPVIRVVLTEVPKRKTNGKRDCQEK